MWINSNKVRIKRSTYDKYTHIVNKHINPYMGDILINELNSLFINEFLKNKLINGRLNDNSALAPSYVRTMSIIISSVIHYAANEKYCEDMKNPINKPMNNKSQIRILNNNEYDKLLLGIEKAADSTDIGILLALYTGLRIGEICALKWDNIDFESKTLKVESTISRINNNGKTKYTISHPKTKTSSREIPIPNKFLPTLKTKYEQLKSNFVISEMDIKTLSEILGHSNVNTTLQIYVHSSMELKRLQINKVFQ